MSSNTTALPLCFMSFGVAAEGLMMAPPGQRLPRRTAIPVSRLKGFFIGMITSGPSLRASLLFSQIDRPLAVSAPLLSSPASPSSRITTGRPPA